VKKALIINEGYSNNLGDQAIKKAIESFFVKKGYRTSFLYLSNPAIKKLPKYTYLNTNPNVKIKKTFVNKLKSFLLFIYWYFKYKKIIIEELKKNDFDLVVIGGGQLIISSGSFALSGFSIAIFWYTFLAKRYSKAKIFIIGVGSSKKFNWFEKKLYTKSFKRIDRVRVRDSFSKQKLKEYFNVDSQLMPDIAFFGDDQNLDNGNIKKNNALIGVTNYDEVYRRYNQDNLTKKEYYDLLFDKYQEYKSKGYNTRVFYTTITDAIESEEFIKYIYQEYGIKIEIMNINNLEDLLSVLKDTDIVFSGRMHALILAMKNNCDIEAFLVSEKLKSFEKEYILNKSDVIKLREEISKELENYL